MKATGYKGAAKAAPLLLSLFLCLALYACCPNRWEWNSATPYDGNVVWRGDRTAMLETVRHALEQYGPVVNAQGAAGVLEVDRLPDYRIRASLAPPPEPGRFPFADVQALYMEFLLGDQPVAPPIQQAFTAARKALDASFPAVYAR